MRCYNLQHYGKVNPDLTAQNAKYTEVRRGVVGESGGAESSRREGGGGGERGVREEEMRRS